MKRFFKQFHRPSLKEDARKFGINLMTASAVGGFVNHLTDMTLLGRVLIVWLGIVGVIIWLFGLHKVGES